MTEKLILLLLQACIRRGCVQVSLSTSCVVCARVQVVKGYDIKGNDIPSKGQPYTKV